MRVLILTILTLFSMEAMAGRFLYTDKAETAGSDLKVVSLIELKYSLSGSPTQILIADQQGKKCILMNRDLSRDNGNELIKLHQALEAAMKNHRAQDGTITVVYCEKDHKGDASNIYLKTLRVEQ